MSDSDDSLEVISGFGADDCQPPSAARPPKRRRVRRDLDTRALLASDYEGPQCIIAVIGNASGRWSNALSGIDVHKPLVEWCDNQLQWRKIPDTSVAPAPHVFTLYGFAVFVRYRFLKPGESACTCPNVFEQELQDIMLRLLRAGKGRRVKSIGYCSAIVKAAAFLPTPVTLDKTVEDMGYSEFQAYLSETISMEKLIEVRVPNRSSRENLLSSPSTFSDLQHAWQEHFDISPRFILPS